MSASPSKGEELIDTATAAAGGTEAADATGVEGSETSVGSDETTADTTDGTTEDATSAPGENADDKSPFVSAFATDESTESQPDTSTAATDGAAANSSMVGAWGLSETAPVDSAPAPSAPPSSSPGFTAGAPRPAERTAKIAKPKAPRKAHLQVARFEPWSVMKFSFVMSLVCFIVLFVAVMVLYMILSGLGVFDAVSSTLSELTNEQSGKGGGLNPASWFSAARILGYTALIGALNVLLITALSTVWAVIYNMAADLVGGVEVTLKEAE